MKLYGRVLGVPYDIRRPTWNKLKSHYWEPGRRQDIDPAGVRIRLGHKPVPLQEALSKTVLHNSVPRHPGSGHAVSGVRSHDHQEEAREQGAESVVAKWLGRNVISKLWRWPFRIDDLGPGSIAKRGGQKSFETGWCCPGFLVVGFRVAQPLRARPLRTLPNRTAPSPASCGISVQFQYTPSGGQHNPDSGQ